MVILQVMSCIEYGGTEAFVYNQCKEIKKKHPNDKILLMICGTHVNEQRKEDFEELGICIYMSHLPSIANVIKIRNDIKTILEKEKVDVIHCHMNLGSFVVIHEAKRLKIPVRIAHSHDTEGFSKNVIRRVEQKFRVNYMVHDSTGLAACSNDAGRYLFGNAFDKREKNCIVIPNGIEIEKYSKVEQEEIIKLQKQYDLIGKYVIGNITRFEEKKNQIFLLEIFKKVTEIIPESVLILGGVDAGMEKEIIEKSKEMGLERQVRFVGRRTDMTSWMYLLDLWVMPSLFEGFGITLLEAQLCGLPALASDRVSKEVDMGYGLLEYIPLEEKSDWINRIVYHYNHEKNRNVSELIERQQQSVYNVKNSAKILYDFYKMN